jgi:hypothetical protein
MIPALIPTISFTLEAAQKGQLYFQILKEANTYLETVALLDIHKLTKHCTHYDRQILEHKIRHCLNKKSIHRGLLHKHRNFVYPEDNLDVSGNHYHRHKHHMNHFSFQREVHRNLLTWLSFEIQERDRNYSLPKQEVPSPPHTPHWSGRTELLHEPHILGGFAEGTPWQKYKLQLGPVLVSSLHTHLLKLQVAFALQVPQPYKISTEYWNKKSITAPDNGNAKIPMWFNIMKRWNEQIFLLKDLHVFPLYWALSGFGQFATVAFAAAIHFPMVP